MSRSKTDQILDLLLDALLERQRAREAADAAVGSPLAPEPAVQPAGPNPPELHDPTPVADPSQDKAPAPALSELKTEPPQEQFTTAPSAPLSFNDTEEETPSVPSPLIPPSPLPSIHLHRMLGRLSVALLTLIILVNIPFNRYGTALARALPDEKALIIRDGLVLKGSGPEFYVLENNQRRWISSLEAFDYYGYSWDQVNEVSDPFLERFPEGRPLHLLMKCVDSPHVYAYENGVKRWIKDIPTFTAEGYVWEEIQIVSCPYLRNLPDGVPIPPDAGEPPQP